MNWIAQFFEKRKQDLADEIDAHLKMEAADRISRGCGQNDPDNPPAKPHSAAQCLAAGHLRGQASPVDYNYNDLWPSE